ncbi:pilus assembly protein [Sesbania bispinosa]|nr:pilus assembly protein [Sesbania bispinosa]
MAKTDSLSRMENLFSQVPDFDGESRLPEPDGEFILAKSETWKAMPTPRAGWRIYLAKSQT